MAPALVAVGAIIVYPLVVELVESFRLRGAFAGVENFTTVVTDSTFTGALKNNLIILVSIPLRVVIALLIAAILFRGIRGMSVYRLAVFLPFIPSIAAIGVIFVYLLNIDGPINAILRAVGLSGVAQGWLTEPGLTMWSVMFVVLWTRIGFAVLIFEARLLSIDRELFQAAAVDGATWYRSFRHIALPELRGAIELVSVLGVIEAFSWSFAYVYVLGQGTNNPRNYIMELYIYERQFIAGLPGQAAASAVLLVLPVLALASFVYWRRGRGETASHA